MPTDPIHFDYHGRSWSIRPAEPLAPHTGEYLIQSHDNLSSIPMNLHCLMLHLGILTPAQPIHLTTLATFLELTAKVDPTPLTSLLHAANSLRHPSN